MMRRVLALIAIVGGLTFTQTFTQFTQRASGGEWYGYGYVNPVAYSVGSPYGYYYYAGYYPSQVVNYPNGLYGYYFPYRYHYAGYPYGYYGNYATYPITYPAAYVATYPTAATVATTVPIAGYPVPAGYKLVPTNVDTSTSESTKPAEKIEVVVPPSASVEGTLPPVPVERSN